MEPVGVYAIVDMTLRASRGKILMFLDDSETAAAVAHELGRRSVSVAIRPLNAQEAQRARVAVA